MGCRLAYGIDWLGVQVGSEELDGGSARKEVVGSCGWRGKGKGVGFDEGKMVPEGIWASQAQVEGIERARVS